MLAAVASAAALLAASPAGAQSVETVEARVSIVEPVAITKLSDLDFGSVAGEEGGTVTLTIETGALCLASGGVVQSGGCEAATFAGSGSAGQLLRIRGPSGNAVILSGPGEDMPVTELTITPGASLVAAGPDPDSAGYLIGAADGNFVFRIGGTLTVNPRQQPGSYSGSFEIQVEYL